LISKLIVKIQKVKAGVDRMIRSVKLCKKAFGRFYM